MNYIVQFEKQALRDIRSLVKSGKKRDINKLHQFLEELKTNPTTGTGNPKPLKHDLSGYWSRRINKKDRLIYEILEEPSRMVVIVSALGHYE